MSCAQGCTGLDLAGQPGRNRKKPTEESCAFGLAPRGMLWRCGGWTGEKALGFCAGACRSRGYFGLFIWLFGGFWGFPGWGEGFRGRFKVIFLRQVTKLCDPPLNPYIQGWYCSIIQIKGGMYSTQRGTSISAGTDAEFYGILPKTIANQISGMRRHPHIGSGRFVSLVFATWTASYLKVQQGAP